MGSPDPRCIPEIRNLYLHHIWQTVRRLRTIAEWFPRERRLGAHGSCRFLPAWSEAVTKRRQIYRNLLGRPLVEVSNMPTIAETEAGARAHPGLALLFCHCGKWAFRVDSHFPLFDPGPAAKRLSVGCPIDWHVVPTADPPPSLPASKAENSVNDVPTRMDPDLIRTIYGEELLARERWLELPETVTANDLVFLEGTFK